MPALSFDLDRTLAIVSGWQIFVVGIACGVALGFLGGHALGFYFGRRLERKRIAKLLAGKTALEIVQQLIATGTIKPTKKKKAPPPAGTPRDETRH